MTVFKPEFIL